MSTNTAIIAIARSRQGRQTLLVAALTVVCMNASAYPTLGTPGARIVVDSVADGLMPHFPGTPTVCTLRDAIVAANTNQAVGGCAGGTDIHLRRDHATGEFVADGIDVITFELGKGTPVIKPHSALPPITEGVRIVGNSGGATRVMLDGRRMLHRLGYPPPGLVVAGRYTSLEYLVVSGFSGGGIVLIQASSDGGHLEPPFTPPDTEPALPEDRIADPCGPLGRPADPSQCDSPSAGGGMPKFPQPQPDRYGTHRIIGTFVGTDEAGGMAVGNGLGGTMDAGILVLASGNQIGGPRAGEGNLVSGNHGHGLLLSGVNNSLVGNSIGRNAARTLPLGNDLNGVRIEGGRFNGATCELTGNHIAYNGGSGVFSGYNACLLGDNHISDNGALGIDVADPGVTANNAIRQRPPNAPVLTRSEIVVGGSLLLPSTRVYGTVTHPGAAPVRIDLFGNSSCDPSGHGEGESPLASATVNGSASRNFSLLVRGVFFNNTFTATASLDGPGLRTTSEFSNCL